MPLPTREEALQQIQEFGLDVQQLQVDEKIIRVKYLGKGKRNIDGFYCVWSVDGSNVVSGYYGSYYPYKQVHNLTGTQDYTLTVNQKEKHRQKMMFIKKTVENEEPDLTIWGKAEPQIEHPYLEKKQITSHDTRCYGDELLIPYRNREGELVGIQRILKNGKKFLVKNSKMKKAYHIIQGSDVCCIAEGFATSASIHKATGWTCITCFNASNIIKVASLFKTEKLVIASDDDWETEKRTGVNTGRKEAEKACRKYKIEHAFPVFTSEKRGTDWNDLAVEEGIDVVKKQLMKYVPLSLMQKLQNLDSQEEREKFLMDSATLLSEYDQKSFSFLKNRIKDKFRISKQFVDDCVRDEKSEEELERIEEAKQKLDYVYFDGKNYMKIEDNKMYNTTTQEVTLLVNIASDGDDVKKQEILNTLHRDKVIGETISQAKPFGKSELRLRIGKKGQYIVESFISTQESLDLRLSQLDDIDIDPKFIEYIEREYPEVIDIWEASLARKFCHHKVAFTLLNVNTAFGKNFFFELPYLTRTFHRSYQIEEFRGNSPDDFIEPIHLFIDEADKFPAHYKTNIPEYKRLYGGLTTITLGMRILACANKLEDLERGVDPQLIERTVKIKPKYKRFDHQGIQQVTSQRMWEKYIINRMLNRLMEWSHDGDFDVKCGEFFQAFVDKYKNDEDYMGLDDLLCENMEQLLDAVIDPDNMRMRELKSNGFDFADHIHQTDAYENQILITSPKRFFIEVFKYFDDSRTKAFVKKYPNIDDLESIKWLENKITKVSGRAKRGVVIQMDYSSDLIKIQKNVTKVAK